MYGITLFYIYYVFINIYTISEQLIIFPSFSMYLKIMDASCVNISANSEKIYFQNI